MMKAFFTLLVSTLLTFSTLAQDGQISIGRVNQMPNLPSPYLMRDWKDVAKKYDTFIFSLDKTGQYLPLMELKSEGNNFPSLQPIILDTYVGSNSSGTQAEAINIMPAIVGASLVGINKSNQNNINWVEKTKDFYNKKNGQNVYLNNYSASSGNDWWYDLMPNVFFYQLRSQYPEISDFDSQFKVVADRWLEAVHKMGGSTTPWTVPQMNYRGWHLSSMTPNASGVVEPEAAGAIAWLLYHAYLETGEDKYLKGAEMATEFLVGLNSNPSYELQLPYGALIAAKMNAEQGTNYNIEKLINWCFDRGPLRGWGVIAGTWNGADVDGLIGEANDQGNDYAFLMNGYQQAAALVPMVKYDKRFARDIAKWTLNLANASRLLYPKYLPAASQDDHAWSTQHDPESVIAYEALKENWEGKPLYGTGDAKRGTWAQTNLGLYGSSHVGYLAAIIDTTAVSGILMLDLNKTDFYGQNDFPSYLIYNPHNQSKQVALPLGEEHFSIYDAITETILSADATGDYVIEVPAEQVRMLVYLPMGSEPVPTNGKLYLDQSIIDYHYGYNFESKLRIKSLEATDTLVQFGQEAILYASVDHASEAIVYHWYLNNQLIESTESGSLSWTAPEEEGTFWLSLEAVDGQTSVQDSLQITIVAVIPETPQISGFNTDQPWYFAGNQATIVCNADNFDQGPMDYLWTISAGSITFQNDSIVTIELPSEEGLMEVSCQVVNDFGLNDEASVQLLIKKNSSDSAYSLAYYPLNANVLDYSGNEYDAVLSGPQSAEDARGSARSAYRFSTGADIIYIENEASLNFQNEIGVSFWVKIDGFNSESFILSHGSWEERWKISVIDNHKLRWTVKTNESVKDLDTSFPLESGQFYHFTVLYTGYSMEIYVNGALDTFMPHSGNLGTTNQAITFGKKSQAESNYYLIGTLDEVRLYNQALAPNQIEVLDKIWSNEVVSATGGSDGSGNLLLYPNPSTGKFYIPHQVDKLELIDQAGRKVPFALTQSAHGQEVEIKQKARGMLWIKMEVKGEIIVKKLLVL